MTYRVEISRRAERDLLLIFDFIRAYESDAAEKWFDGLEERVENLAYLPKRGTVTDYDPTLYFVLYGNKPHVYRILYRIDDRTMTVAIRHIRHGARKPLRRVP